MNYEELKRSLGIQPTALDTGMPDDPRNGKQAKRVSHYLAGKRLDERKVRAPANDEDLSRLNAPHYLSSQRNGSIGGKNKKKSVAKTQQPPSSSEK